MAKTIKKVKKKVVDPLEGYTAYVVEDAPELIQINSRVSYTVPVGDYVLIHPTGKMTSRSKESFEKTFDLEAI